MSNPAPGWQKHPDHIVELTPFKGTVTVTAGSQLVAKSTDAIQVVESHHGTVWYMPLADVMAKLSNSETKTYCPFKGYASYRNIELTDGAIDDALWSYEAPFDECLEIKDYVSFYTDKVDVVAS